MQARLLAIILLCVLPLAILSSVMAWHNYTATVDAASARARAVAETLRGQSDQQILDISHLLDALSAQPQLRDPAACAALLRLAHRLQAGRVLRLSLLDADGTPLCATPPVPGLTATALPHGTSLILLPLPDGADGDRRPLLRFERPTTGPAGPAVLVAAIPLGWTATELANIDLWHAGRPGGLAAAFLVDTAGRPHPLCPDCTGAVGTPSPDPRLDLHDGRYELPHLVGDVGLLVTTRPTVAERAALSLFMWRVTVVALLLALGLLAVMLGASWFITRPLRAVTAGVTAWRRAGAFAPGSTRTAPIELRKLSYAFADATRSLAAHEDRLRKAETKQELLIKEIHHRVKNNLQIIASLLNLQANRIRQDAARAEFASARDRVRALATLHRHLYSEGELDTLNMRSFLEELCGQLFQAIGEKEGQRIALQIEAPEIVMSTDQAVPLALVVTEAVSNAIKYAFPDRRTGSVSVRLTEDVPGIAKLVIEDDGIGIPAGRAETETGIRDGLGIQLIRGFARQLGATLDVEDAGARTGTRYVLMVPLQPHVQHADEQDTASASS